VVARVAALGQRIQEGEAVVVVEAMKMETAVPCPSEGTVIEVRCRAGQVVRPGQPLVVVEPAREATP
jgi:biotin carboxyl carrier protein